MPVYISVTLVNFGGGKFFSFRYSQPKPKPRSNRVPSIDRVISEAPLNWSKIGKKVGLPVLPDNLPKNSPKPPLPGSGGITVVIRKNFPQLSGRASYTTWEVNKKKES